MGQFNNEGKLKALTVFGNPDSFQSLIRNHGQLCKIKQALICACAASNHGSADFLCEICGGDGYVYTYQRNFFIADEDSPVCGAVLTPYWSPILSVISAQNIASEIQGGITDLIVSSFTDTEITLSEAPALHDKKRVTYTFDGWTYVASEKLVTDATNKIMYASGTVYDAEYQSSNPLGAFADIAQIIKIWNNVTGEELTSYKFDGKTISTTRPIVDDQMYIEYYKSDLSQVINADLTTRDPNEGWTSSVQSGEVKMAFYPFWDLAKGDLIVLPATVLWRNQILPHLKDLDKLWEQEIFQLNSVILDASGNTYANGTDYILQGNAIKWIGSKPAINAVISVRYGYKPSFIVFEDNPQPNNLENKIYPKLVLAKSWSKTDKDEVTKLIIGA